eukprot:COSAG03_NODE_4_length_27239_cov_28.640862_1_plen_174_part_00
MKSLLLRSMWDASFGNLVSDFPCQTQHFLKSDTTQSDTTSNNHTTSTMNQLTFRTEQNQVEAILVAMQTSNYEHTIVSRTPFTERVGDVLHFEERVVIDTTIDWQTLRSLIETLEGCQLAASTLLPSQHFDFEERTLDEAIAFVNAPIVHAHEVQEDEEALVLIWDASTGTFH